ncbi:hypothetical protein [Ignatzschineria indica]|nr:hypothetical protein [Ignatzschineria indica]
MSCRKSPSHAFTDLMPARGNPQLPTDLFCIDLFLPGAESAKLRACAD